MHVRFGLLLVTAIGLLVVAGCGEDESSSSAAAGDSRGLSVTTSSLDKAEFIEQAEVACARVGKGTIGKVERYLNKEGSKGLSEEELTTSMYKQLLGPIIEEMIAAIRDLGAPDGEEGEVARLLAVQQEAVDELQGANKVGGTAEFENYFVEATKEFEKYGFESACMIAGWV